MGIKTPVQITGLFSVSKENRMVC